MTTFSRQNDAGSRASIKKIRTRSRSRLGTEIVLPWQRDVTPPPYRFGRKHPDYEQVFIFQSCSG